MYGFLALGLGEGNRYSDSDASSICALKRFTSQRGHRHVPNPPWRLGVRDVDDRVFKVNL